MKPFIFKWPQGVYVMHEKMHKQTMATGIEIDVQLNGRPCSKFHQMMNLE